MTPTPITMGEAIANVALFALCITSIYALAWVLSKAYLRLKTPPDLKFQHDGTACTEKELRVAWQLALMENKRRDLSRSGFVPITHRAIPGERVGMKEYVNSVSTEVRSTFAVQRAKNQRQRPVVLKALKK